MAHRVCTAVALVALVAIVAPACRSALPGAVHADDHVTVPLADATATTPDDRMRVRAVPPEPVWGKTAVAYEVGPPDCVIRWTLERSGINTGIARQDARCAWPMDRQVELLSRLLAHMIEREPLFRRLQLADTSPIWRELIARVIIEANARGWDARRGRPADGRRTDVFLTELLQQGPPLAEWRALSAAQHRAVTADVDEVSVEDARAAPGFSQLAARGFSARDQVIVRFVLGLTFTPLP